MRTIQLLIFGCIFVFAACGNDPSNSTPSDEFKLAIAKLRPECLRFCRIWAACYAGICHEDYPGSVSTFDESFFEQHCVTHKCETDFYLKLKEERPDYLECVNVQDCRSLVTGRCGDEPVMCIDEDVNSTPHF
jgi:hypothetical protein